MLGASTFFSLQGFSNQAIAEDVSDGIRQLHQADFATAVHSEDLWKRVQAAYTVSKSYLNLNNGGVSPQPKVVLDAEKKYLEQINEIPSLYLWRNFIHNRDILRQQLADLGGCNEEEIAIVQNTTEGLNNIMLGVDWEIGDEVILSKQDYSTAKVGWEQLARRKKIKLVWVDLPSPIEDDEAIVEAYCSKFTKRTKLIFLTQIINWTGQILPVDAMAKICTNAREKGVFSLVDGAHSFAHIDFKIPDLKCDAYATSLHKWLSAPLGMGLLYMRQSVIEKIWPMFPSPEEEINNIRKFEHRGTLSLAKDEATFTAIEFHNRIGIELKEARLRYLKNYWSNLLKDYDRVKFYTSFEDRYAGAIALFDIDGLDYSVLSKQLSTKFRIHQTISIVDGAQGVRISPNLYTLPNDLDRLVEAVIALMKRS